MTKLNNGEKYILNLFPNATWLVVDRVLGLVLAQGSTATGSLTRRVKPERLARQDRNYN